MNKSIIFLFALLTLTNVVAQKFTTPYTIASPEYKTQGEELVIQNMSKVRSQGYAGLCYAFSAATLLQKYWCDDLRVSNCAAVDDTETISPVVLTGLAKPVNNEASIIYLSKSTDLDSGGDPANLLKNATIKHSFCAESNFPFDRFFGTRDSSNMDHSQTEKQMVKLIDEKITKLQKIYNQRKTGDVKVEPCPECFDAVNAVLPVNINNRVNPVEIGLSKNTFEEFLFESYFRYCNPKVKLTTPTYGEYPTTDIVVDVKKYQADLNHPIKTAFINQIKKVLRNNVPLQTSFCALKVEGDDTKCAGNHAAVISGYKTVCKPNGQCLEMLKIHNSYGASWQKKYNDGWVVANDILNSLAGIIEIQKIEHSNLSWITDGPLK